MISRFYTDGLIDWDGEEISAVHDYSNHSVMELIGSAEGLSMPGYIVKGSHDLYTAVEQWEMEESGVSLDDKELTSEYWYVYMAEPDKEFGCVISLNAKNYTMEDAIEFAKSVMPR